MVHLEGGRALAACNVPQSCRLVIRSGRQRLSVNTKCNIADTVRVSLEERNTVRITARVAVRVMCKVRVRLRVRVRDYVSSQGQRYAAINNHNQRFRRHSGVLE